tara:strand:+ start:259 stop:558 length:300 start_codon:yes stop_codon:yes gene_type:complete
MSKIKWEQDEKIQWDSNPYKWDDVKVLITGGASVSAGAVTFDEITKDFSKEDKKRLVKIVCKVNGIKYEDEKWKKSAGKVNATQVKIAVSKVLGVKIDI